jgi:nucleoside-diphosphate-sugar epimerase
MAYQRNYGLNIKIARFHNIFGELGSWNNGKEKAPAAMCRKVAETPDGGTIEVWGDGEQTRSFLYIDVCLEGVRRLMESDFQGPVNIGSDEMVSINRLVDMVKEVAGKPNIKITHVDGPLGVRGRTSDNRLIKEKLNWAPDYPLIEGLKKTYPWIEQQVKLKKKDYPWTS